MNLVTFIEFMAVIVSAIYGVLLATRTGMDFVGSFAVAFAAAFGGGTLRDLFLDRHPLFWMEHPHYPVTVFLICLLASFFLKFLPRIKPLLLIPDAVGMALFTIVGTSLALEARQSWFVAALLGTITGTFGGVLADIICNRVPSLFTPAPLHATCAFTGAWTFIFGSFLSLPPTVVASSSALVVVGFRILSVRNDWRFPPLRESPNRESA